VCRASDTAEELKKQNAMISLNLFTAKQQKNLMVPERWDELSQEQLIQIAGILRGEKEPLPAELLERDLLLMQAVTGIHERELRQMEAPVVCESLLPLIEWLKGNCDLTKQLIPTLEVGGTVFYGPADFLQNISLEEFDFAERELFSWHIDMAEKQLLYRFVACLYRPGKKDYDLEKNADGDCREPFNYNLSLYHAKLIAHYVPEEICLGIVLFYKGCRHYIVDRFKEVFAGGKQEGEPQEPAYFDLIRAIAKEGIYGTFEAVAKMPLYTALHEMYSTLMEQKRLEEMSNQSTQTEEDELQ